jgi:hypothetical protein
MRRGPSIPLWEVISTSAHQATGALLLMATVQGAAWSWRMLAGVSADEPITATATSA